MIKKYFYVILLIIWVIFVYWNILSNPLVNTFNFADNLWYAKSIELFKYSIENKSPFYIPEWSFFIDKDIKILLISPLWQFLWVFFSYLLPVVAYINIVIIWNTFLSLLFSYKLFHKISHWKRDLSTLWAVIFWWSSLLLYASWLNLMWLFFIPLLLIYLVNYTENKSFKNIVYIWMSSFLLFLCSTYFIPIFIIVLLWYLIVFRKNLSLYNILSILFSVLLSVIIAFLIYKLPFIYFDIIWVPENMNNIAENSNIKSSIDIFKIFLPNNNNILTSWQLSFFKNYLNIPVSHFRYSLYLPFSVLIIFLLSLWLKSPEKSPDKRYKKLWKYLLLLSLILFLWENVIIHNLNFGFNNLLYYIKLLPYGEIFRKSAYFFFPLSLGISFFIVSSFNNKLQYNKYKFLFIPLAIITLLSNIWPYWERNFKIIDKKEAIVQLEDKSTILLLPNSSYNNWELQYYLLKYRKWFRTFDAWNATLPNYEKSIIGISSETDSLLYRKPFKENTDLNDCKIDTEYIFLFKSYIENFFFYNYETWIHLRAKNKIESCNNIYKIYEDKDLIIYKI